MGISAGPNIVRDSSLVLDLDASDINSAPKDTVINLNPNSQNFFGSPYNTNPGTVSTGSFVAPDSTNTATLFTEPTIPNNINRIYLNPVNTLIPDTYYNLSFYVKANGRTKGNSFWEWTNGRVGVSYDLTAVTVTPYLTGANTLLTSSITSAGNGWYRISYAAKDSTSPVGINTFIRLADDTGALTYTGNGLSGSYVWGVQLEKGTSASTYVSTSSTVSLNSTWYDLSGNNITGSLNNGVTFNGETQGSLYFDGSNDYVTCGNPSALTFPQNAFSLVTWFKYPASGFFFNKGVGNVGGFNLWYTGTQLRFQIYSGSVAPAPINVVAGTINSNTYYQASATYDGSVANTYLNGVLVGTQTNSQTIVNTTGSLQIGYRADGVNTNYSSGSISVVQVYNRALSATEVQQNYNALKSRFGLR